METKTKTGNGRFCATCGQRKDDHATVTVTRHWKLGPYGLVTVKGACPVRLVAERVGVELAGGRTFTADVLQRARELLRSKSQRAVARELGVSQPGLSRALKRAEGAGSVEVYVPELPEARPNRAMRRHGAGAPGAGMVQVVQRTRGNRASWRPVAALRQLQQVTA